MRLTVATIVSATLPVRACSAIRIGVPTGAATEYVTLPPAVTEPATSWCRPIGVAEGASGPVGLSEQVVSPRICITATADRTERDILM